MKVAKRVIADLIHLLQGFFLQILGVEHELNLGPTLANPTVASDLDI